MWESISQYLNIHMCDLYLLIRTVVLFIMTLISIRIMGKRTLAQLSPFDLLTIIIIGSAVAVPMEDEKVPFIHGVIPIVTITIINYLIQTVILENRKIENFLQGTPSVLIRNGEIILKNLRKERVTLADLSVLLREKNVRNIDQVQEATFEPSGRLSVIRREVEEAVTLKDLGLSPSSGLFPTLVIDNGEVVYNNLQQSRVSISQLVAELQKRGIKDLGEVAKATLDETGSLVVYKQGQETERT